MRDSRDCCPCTCTSTFVLLIFPEMLSSERSMMLLNRTKQEQQLQELYSRYVVHIDEDKENPFLNLK